MSDRHNSSGYWSNEGSGHPTQYPNTINEEELEDEEYYEDTGEQQTYASEESHPQQQYQQQGYWTDEPQDIQQQGLPVYTPNTQPWYEPTDADQGDVIYTPTSYTGASLDVNFSVPPSEHGQGQDDAYQGPAVPPLPEADAGPDAGDRTQDFVAQRRDSYDRREEFHTAPDRASIRRVVNSRQRIRDAEARARQRGSRSGGSGGGGSGSGSGTTSGGGAGGSSRSGGKSSGSKGGKGSSSKGGRS